MRAKPPLPLFNVSKQYRSRDFTREGRGETFSFRDISEIRAMAVMAEGVVRCCLICRIKRNLLPPSLFPHAT